MAWCVAGVPGSGKSTFGRELARLRRAVLLDQDTATNPLLARIAALVGAGDDLDHPALGAEVRSARYRCLIDVAVENLALGTDVVIVAPFSREVADAGAWREMTELLDPAGVCLVWVKVPPEVAVERRRARGLPRDVAANLSDHDRRVAAAPVVAHVVADGTFDPAQEAGRVARIARSSDDSSAAVGGGAGP